MRAIIVLASLCAACICAADIRYVVSPDIEKNRLKVTVVIPARGEKTQVQIPNWSPGSYRLANFAGNIEDMQGSDTAGAALQTERTDNNTWTISNDAANAVRVSYFVPAQLQYGTIHYSGPPTYVYVLGRKNEKCVLQVSVPDGWRVAVGLDEVSGQKNTFSASDYDVLADNPVTIGEFRMDTYSVRGKPHYIVLRGIAKDDVDMEKLKKYCSFVTQSMTDFFQDIPYNKYVWHFDVGDRTDGGGGLEHLSSTQIGLGSGLGPRSFSVIAHEFFHLWNVKRTRSKPLGPFDYLVLPKTGALWFLEGTTDYYASLLPTRYGWRSEEDLFDDLISNMDSVRSNSARLQVSPFDASFRVGEASNGRGNSSGYNISYYNLGWLAGFCLDVEIREKSNGKYSFDDVTRALYAMCKGGKPGFEEDEIRKQCVKFGGASLGEFYDAVIMRPGEMPIEAQLAKLGLKTETEKQNYVETGFSWAPAANEKAIRVTRVREPANEVLKQGDLVLAVSELPLQAANNRRQSELADGVIAKIAAGQAMSLTIKRDDETKTVQITPVSRTREVKVVRPDLGASDAQKKLMKDWIYDGKQPLVKKLSK